MHVEFFEDQGIITVNPVEGFKGPEAIEHAKENLGEFETRLGNALKGALVFLPPFYINAEATRFYKKNGPNIPIVLVADSFFKRMIGNFLFSMINASRPIKLFAVEEEARTWLTEKIEEAKIQKAV